MILNWAAIAEKHTLNDPMLPVIHTGRWLSGELHRSAVITQDGQYRWSLQRQWSAEPMCAWVMLNPSTADAYTDDPTIRRCMAFAKSWGYGGIPLYVERRHTAAAVVRRGAGAMSKESKPRDRWSQVFTAASDRPADFCKGCGYYRAANGEHRGDCTAVER